jgi:hypothetical protein
MGDFEKKNDNLPVTQNSAELLSGTTSMNMEEIQKELGRVTNPTDNIVAQKWRFAGQWSVADVNYNSSEGDINTNVLGNGQVGVQYRPGDPKKPSFITEGALDIRPNGDVNAVTVSAGVGSPEFNKYGQRIPSNQHLLGIGLIRVDTTTSETTQVSLNNQPVSRQTTTEEDSGLKTGISYTGRLLSEKGNPTTQVTAAYIPDIGGGGLKLEQNLALNKSENLTATPYVQVTAGENTEFNATVGAQLRLRF